ncbi:RidA family protein [Vibrio nigripulchritudo]|uniref:RidA family protein n=1 Tax=Vibrio nigripulchritudo TaxID=28173 RepID=UPI0003B2421C|nr:RidA family protein [Vibrio nigripulchritudo]CCN71127.1 Putative translation initiation inhibitor, yjgF family [Vibrio nigripulchritudo SFn118]
MAHKQAFHNSKLPDFRNAFSWGLKLTDFSDIFFVTGHADCNPNFVTQHSGDPVAQTKLILNQMQSFLEEAGYSVDDIVRTDWTFTNDVNSAQFEQIAALWEEFLSDVPVKPATGTLRYVQRLGMPDMMVEYEMMLAR